jgi:2-oxoisovalerate dehydrogenase E2 component (dihydrolipoyl transacylase)
MSKEMLMPVMAESIVEAEILKWMVKEGDTVTEGQMIAEVMTDKVTTEIPAPYSGILEKIVAKEGTVVEVKKVIAMIGDGSSTAAPAPIAAPVPAASAVKLGDDSQSATESATNSSYGMPTKAVALSFGNTVKVASSSPVKTAGVNKFGRPLAVPAARKLAREAGLDIMEIPGSGPNGRVGVEDVKDYIEVASASTYAGTTLVPSAAPVVVTAPVVAASGGMTVPPPQYRTPKGLEHLETRTPLRGMRRVISNAMVASHLYTVRTLTVDEVNLTELVALRERLKPAAEKAGTKITYLPFIFKAVASALKAFPNVNSSYDEASGEVVHKRYYNIGCAVDTEAGLIVPVVKNVDSKSILEIAASISELAGKAREGKLSPDEISGSSFAVTNIGSAGSLLSFPIINAPDAAILGVHTIVDRPIVKDGQIVIGKMMYLSLSFDHRLIDGAEAARFVKHLTRLLENPDLLLLEAI